LYCTADGTEAGSVEFLMPHEKHVPSSSSDSAEPFPVYETNYAVGVRSGVKSLRYDNRDRVGLVIYVGCQASGAARADDQG
jgi:hypothetical protein